MKELFRATGRFVLTVMMFLLSAQISAQSIVYPCQKLIENDQFYKAGQALFKLLDKDANNCEVHYGYSMYFRGKQNLWYDLRKAYDSMRKAEECYQKADEKTLKKLQKHGYSADQFKEELRKIRQIALQDIETEKTVASCEVFMNIFPDDEEVPRVKNQQYEFAFAEAQKKGTEAAYRAYINDYPQSPRLAEAQQLAEKARKKEVQAAFQKALSEAESSGRCGSSLTWTYKNNELTVWGNGEIPNYGYWDSKPWDNVESGVKSIVIKSGVTRLGSNAFKGCHNCKSITIPSSVAGMNSDPFAEYIENIYYNGSVQEWMEFAPKLFKSMDNIHLYNLYLNGYKVSELRISEGITTITANAFYKCKSLTAIVLPISVTSIEQRAFYFCQNLRTLSLGKNLQKIGNEAFRYCKQIESVTFPNTLQSIGSEAFDNCELLRSVKIPASSSLSNVGDGAFNNCKNLPVVDGIRYADTYCVGAADNSKSIYTVKEGTRWIGDDAFQSCVSLNSVTIPASVEFIGGSAFSGCKNLATIYFNGSLAQWCNMNRRATGYGDYQYDLYIDGDLIEDYVIPEGITSIQPSTFSKVRNLRTVTLPNTVTRIGSQAFMGSNLVSISLGKDIQNIGDYAFSNCAKLDYISIPNSIPSVGTHAFYCCRIPVEVTKEGVVENGEYTWELFKQNFVDLGLPSGTLWENRESELFYTSDEARAKYGDYLPSWSQQSELINKCSWMWTGKGFNVVGPNGNSIFLPANNSGCYCHGVPTYGGPYGNFWGDGSYCLFYNIKDKMVDQDPRCPYEPVRLVIKKSESK